MNNQTTGEVYIYSSLSLHLLKISRRHTHQGQFKKCTQLGWEHFGPDTKVLSTGLRNSNRPVPLWPLLCGEQLILLPTHASHLSREEEMSSSVLDDTGLVRTQKCTSICKGEKEAIGLDITEQLLLCRASQRTEQCQAQAQPHLSLLGHSRGPRYFKELGWTFSQVFSKTVNRAEASCPWDRLQSSSDSPGC